MDMQIYFPHLGIYLEHVGKNFSIFGFTIAYYGVVIVIGMLLAIGLIMYTAKSQGENPDQYYDVSLMGILVGIVGARVYYVFFSWDMYRDDLWQIFNIRNGGLAIYGGILFGALTVFVYTRVKKRSFLHMADILILGVILGQIMGRWGNFFNREAFGEYTDGLFAMQLPVSAVRQNEITQTMWEHTVTLNGVEFIQVSPTFLYESLWNLALLLILLALIRHKRFDGQVFLTYVMGYGLGRIWIEGLRTDQLLVPGTHLPVSQLLSGAMVAAAVTGLVIQSRRCRNQGCLVNEKNGKPDRKLG